MRRALLGARGGQALRSATPRRGWSARSCSRSTSFSVWAAAKSPDLPAGHRHRRPASARDLAGGQGGPALRAADRHADLVPDGRGDVAVALRVLGDRHADRADGDAAAADRLLPRHPDGPRVDERPRRRPAGLQRRLAQHDRHRRRHRDGRHHRRRDHADRPRPAHDRVRRVRLAGQRDRDAAVHRLRVPRAGPGRADDGELRAGRHADGAGGRRAGRAVRAS